jgi:hypothetical protein
MMDGGSNLSWISPSKNEPFCIGYQGNFYDVSHSVYGMLNKRAYIFVRDIGKYGSIYQFYITEDYILSLPQVEIENY